MTRKHLLRATTDYISLEKNMVKYSDLVEIPVVENGEEFISIPSVSKDSIIGKYMGLNDMARDFPKICVRRSVKEKLAKVDNFIRNSNSTFRLMVTYGYRSLEVQEKYFIEQKNIISKSQIPKGSTIDEEVHRLIAVPCVSGHPTGGAVDVLIVNKDSYTPANFGSKIYDFSTKDIYTFSPYISEEAKKNRMLLRDAMMSQGFAPYDGEWWHFSYGDKEWAFYYKQVNAIYSQKKSSELMIY